MNLDDLLRRHWGICGATTTELAGGMNSRTWRVERAGATYVAKEVPHGELASFAGGCEVAARLADAGLTTGRPVPTTTGSAARSTY